MYVAVHLLNKARSDRTMARLREVQAPKTVVLRARSATGDPFAEVVSGRHHASARRDPDGS